VKKKVWDYEKDKMIVQTGHATFDRQTNVISTGNIIANTMLGFHCRPASNTINPLGTERPHGYLREYDLQGRGLPYRVRQSVIDVTEKEPAWVYKFFHYNSGRQIVHGYVITRPGSNEILRTFITGPTYRSALVIHECAKYVGERL